MLLLTPHPGSQNLVRETHPQTLAVMWVTAGLALLSTVGSSNKQRCRLLLPLRSCHPSLIPQACPTDAKLWCALGDITQQDEHYAKAWEVSNHRSSRAQRSLGR